MQPPLDDSTDSMITIVSVVLNDPCGLRRTQVSLNAQVDRQFQWIVVDGGSTPPTSELVKQISNAGEARIIEGPDEGAYDGMNKGVQGATSEWILFLNAGDELCNPNTIAQLRHGIRGCDVDIVFGDYERITCDGRASVNRALALDVLRYAMPFCHQSVVTRRSILASHPFAQTLAADWRFFSDRFHDGTRFQKIEMCIARFHEGGLSSRYWMHSWLDRVQHLSENGRLSSRIMILLSFNLCKHLYGQVVAVLNTWRTRLGRE